MPFDLPFEKIDDHIIADLGGWKALIDTGSPATLGSRPLPFAGREYPAPRSFMGISLEAISGEVGEALDWVIGADVLHNFRIEIDWTGGKITVHEDGVAVPAGETMELVTGIPVISVVLNGRRIPMFFDTGAKISYGKKELIDMVPVSGKARDFYPGYGPFETSLREVPAMISGRELTLTVGQLPSTLEGTLLMSGVQGIVGNDIFRTFSKVSLDYPAKRFEAKA